MKISSWLGLDISKDKIDCYLIVNEQFYYFIIKNNQMGFHELLTKLFEYSVVLTELHACCEATNIYYLAVAQFLYARKVKMSVVNPAVIKSYAKFKLKRVKTDKQDAKLIAKFCQKEQPEAWQPESAEQFKLKNLHRRIEQLQQMQTMEKNRLAVADEVSRSSIEQVLDCLGKQIAECQVSMQNLIDNNKILKHKQKILQTITGIGKTTAQILLAVMSDIGRFPTARHLVSWLGLSPIIKDSGKKQGQSVLSKMGSRSIRKALYMPARSACTRSKLWRSWFDKQLERGKHPKQIYVMMMVKLVKYAYACLKSNKPFDESRHQDVGAEAKGAKIIGLNAQ